MDLYERITGSSIFRAGAKQGPRAQVDDDIESLVWLVSGRDPIKFLQLYAGSSISECLLAAAMLVSDPPQPMRIS